MTKQFTQLTDYQWAAISPFLPLKRKRKLDLFEVINAILWLLRTGCQWRNLPDQYPHWQAVYYYFDRWKTDGTLERINRAGAARAVEPIKSKTRRTRGISIYVLC